MIVAFTQATGPTTMFFLAVIVAVAYSWRCGLPRGWALPAAVGLANICSHVLKDVIRRPRPPEELRMVHETNFSMPSGHAVGAAAFAVVITWIAARRWAVLAWLLTGLVGASRIYVHVHWPTDVLVGWVLGAAVAFLVLRWLGPPRRAR